MFIDNRDSCYIVVSHLDYSVIETVEQELNQLNQSDDSYDVERYLENLKHRFFGIGIGIGSFPIERDAALTRSIKDGAKSNRYECFASHPNQSVWYVSAIYEDGEITYVHHLHNLRVS